MCTVSEEYINEILNHVAAENSLTEWKITRRDFEAFTQNYFGVLIPIDLNGKTNEKAVSFDLVLKLAPTDERFRVSGALTLFFANEVFVYSTVLRKYEAIQSCFLTSPFVMPKCFYVREEYCKEAIVMENMCAYGYRPYSDAPFLDHEHMIVSLKSLAKFHALSFILQNRDENLHKKVREKCEPLNEATNKRFMEILKDRLSRALETFAGTEYIPLLQRLKENCVKFVEATAVGVKGLAVCHGDMWKENILFKYENQNPKRACLIDYQTARTSSPAFDVLYLITTSSNTELRKSHFRNLLFIYYETFEKFLSEASLSSEVYSRDNFEYDLKVISPACLIIANTALWLSNGLQTEGHVRSKRVYTTPEEKAEFTENYKTIVKNIIDDYKIYGYLCTVDTENNESLQKILT